MRKDNSSLNHQTYWDGFILYISALPHHQGYGFKESVAQPFSIQIQINSTFVSLLNITLFPFQPIALQDYELTVLAFICNTDLG